MRATLLPNIYGKTLDGLKGIADKLEFPGYTVNQLCDWLYKKHAMSFDQMTNLSKETRKALADNYALIRTPPVRTQVSSDGTKKYLFKAASGKHHIETVLIPEKGRNTLCISSQAGCAMNCVFCMTGKQGFQGNLTTDEILNQITSIPERESLSNIVFMGMGEPLANLSPVNEAVAIMTSGYGFGWSPSRITISTIGLLPVLDRLIEETDCHIAISLHNPFSEERIKLMPSEENHPIRQVVERLKDNGFTGQRRLSFEYIMIRDFNDSFRHVNGITRLLNGLKCRINLIRYHEIPGADLRPSSEDTILAFKNRLNQKGILTTIRASRGLDILAACGMLSTKYNT